MRKSTDLKALEGADIEARRKEEWLYGAPVPEVRQGTDIPLIVANIHATYTNFMWGIKVDSAKEVDLGGPSGSLKAPLSSSLLSSPGRWVLYVTL